MIRETYLVLTHYDHREPETHEVRATSAADAERFVRISYAGVVGVRAYRGLF